MGEERYRTLVVRFYALVTSDLDELNSVLGFGGFDSDWGLLLSLLGFWYDAICYLYDILY